MDPHQQRPRRPREPDPHEVGVTFGSLVALIVLCTVLAMMTLAAISIVIWFGGAVGVW